MTQHHFQFHILRMQCDKRLNSKWKKQYDNKYVHVWVQSEVCLTCTAENRQGREKDMYYSYSPVAILCTEAKHKLLSILTCCRRPFDNQFTLAQSTIGRWHQTTLCHSHWRKELEAGNAKGRETQEILTCQVKFENCEHKISRQTAKFFFITHWCRAGFERCNKWRLTEQLPS